MAILRRPFVWIPLLLVLLFGGAVVAGITLVPGLVRSQGQAWVAKNLKHKVLTMGAIRFDPWQLLLEIHDIAIADTAAPQAPLVAIKDLVVDASIASVWKLSPRLDAVSVTAPMVDAVLRSDGSLNLAELMPPDDGTPTPQVWIGRLSVGNGVVHFTDARARAPVRKTLTPVTFSLDDFSTTRNEGGAYTLTATSDAGEHFDWTGNVGMAPLASEGRFTIAALKLLTIGRFAGDLLPVALDAGTIDLAGHYRFAAPPAAAAPAGKSAAVPPPQFDAEISSLRLADAAITASTGDKIGIRALTVAPTHVSLAGDTLTLGAVTIDGISVARPTGERGAITGLTLAATRYAIKAGVADIGAVALNGLSITGHGKGAATLALGAIGVAPSTVRMTPHQAEIGAVTVTDLRGEARVAADNSISVPGLYPMALPKTPAANGPAWTVSLAGFTLDKAALHVDVARPRPARDLTLDLTPVMLKLGPLDSGLAAPLAIDASARLNGKAQFAAHGTASIKAQTADMAIDLKALPLADFAALAVPGNVQVRQGRLDVKGRVQLASARGGPAAHFTGNAGVSGFEINQTSGDPLVAWKQLAVSGIDFHQAPMRLAIRQIAFDTPVSHVIVTREAKLNLATVAGIDQDTTAPATDSVAPAAVAATPAAAPAAVAKPGATRIKVLAPVSNTLNAAGKLFPITIGAITVRNGTIGFDDHSIEPNFSASIKGFTGKVSGLSTAPGSQANFDLHGYVIDRFSPVTITGRANVFAYDADTDLTAKFSNIELPVFNPYSGRFAGYAIARGKLSTTIHYRIVNRGLDAQHKIVIDQLKWGEATDSKQKVSLPIRLATSLLKDRHGVIDLDLPVKGTLDDPTFRIWPIVWKVVGNLLAKIVTAPFTAIGSLFGGGDKAQFVDFAPGSADLPPDADKALKAIAKGLADKPEINLDIPAGSGIREDAEAMTTARLQAAVLAGRKGPVGDDYAALDAGKKADRLKAIYKESFGKAPKFPGDTVEKAGLFAGGAARDAAAESQVKWLEGELRPKFAPADKDLAALGQARADAVKAALLDGSDLDPTRVFIATDKQVTAKDGKVEMELAVK